MVSLLKRLLFVLCLSSAAFAQANLPSGTTASGTINYKNIAAPSTPASGRTLTWTDSTSKIFCAKNDAGTLSCTVIPSSAPSHEFFNALSAGAFTSAQPDFSDLSGSLACAQLPTFTGDLTNTACAISVTALSLSPTPTLCTAGDYARGVDANGNATGCTSAAAGSGTVTSIATTSPIAGGTITTTGTISCPTCAIGPGSSTTNHLAKFSGTDGLTLADGGAIPAGTVTSIATTSPITGGTITGTGTIACATCAIGPGSSTANHLAKFSGTDGITLADGGAIPTGTVTSVGFTVNSGSSSGIFAVTGSPVTSSGTLDIASAGTSGGIPYFSSSSVLSSSAALTNHALVVGGGAAATPAALASLGTTTTVLHGNAAANPTFGAVSLTADVSGTLPVANGGTGVTSAQGNGSLVQLSTGSTSTNHVVTYDANGNAIDSGVAISSLVGSGTGGTATLPQVGKLVCAASATASNAAISCSSLNNIATNDVYVQVCVYVLADSGVSTMTPSDTLTNSYNTIKTFFGSVNNAHIFTYWAKSSSGGADTFTCTSSSAGTNRMIVVFIAQGVSGTSPVDVTNSNSGSTTVFYDSTSFTTTQDNDLAFLVSVGGGTGTTWQFYVGGTVFASNLFGGAVGVRNLGPAGSYSLTFQNNTVNANHSDVYFALH